MATGTLDPQRTSTIVDDEHPWPGLVSYNEHGAAFFFGRDREIAELARLVRQEVLTVLFGKSGLGKSSLLRAGLAPVIREAEFLPIFIRLDHSLLAPPLEMQVKTRIAETLTDEDIEADPPSADESLWEYFHRRGSDWWDADNRLLKPVLIFDQFEELLTMGQDGEASGARTSAFLNELEDLIENRVPISVQKRFEAERGLARQYDLERVAYRVILSLREDFLADLESLHDRLRQIITNRFRLLPMSGSQALDVILKPQAHPVAESVALEIVHFVSSSERSRLGPALGRATIANRQVEPALLSVVLRELNNHRIRSGAATITADLVSGQRATEILEQFFERGLEGMSDAIREFILDELLTSSGARNRVAEEDALNKYGIPAQAIATLIDRRILQRQLSGSVKWLELTHDTLADVVRKDRTEQGQRRAVAEAAAREAAVRSQLARTHRLIAAFALLLLVAGAGLAFAVYSQSKLSASNRSLEEQQRALAASNRQLREQQAALADARDGLAGKNDELRRHAEAEGGSIVAQLRTQLDEWDAAAGARVREQLARINELSTRFQSPALKRDRILAGVFGAESLYSYGYFGEGIAAAAAAVAAADGLSSGAPADDPTTALVAAGARYAVARGLNEAGRDTEAEAQLREATRLLAVALRGDETVVGDARRIQLLALSASAEISARRGLVDQAIAAYQRLLAALDRAPGSLDARHQHLRAVTLLQLGFLEDEFDKSLPYYARSRAIATEHAARNPDDLRWTRLKADLSYRQAYSMMNAERFEDTKRLLEEAKSAADSIAHADRDDRRTAYVRAMIGDGLTQLYQKTGETPRAQATLREALAISSPAARQDPFWTSMRMLDGILHARAADMAATRLQSAVAADKPREQATRDKEYALSLQIFENLARDAPRHAENRRNLAIAATAIAINRSGQKDYAGAMRFFELARRSLEQILPAVKARPRYQAKLAFTQKLVGYYVHTPAGRRAEAQQAFVESVEIDSAVAAAAPTAANFVTLGDSFRWLGDSYLDEGSIERASDTYAKSLSAYDQGLSRFPGDDTLVQAKGEMALYFAQRWRGSKRLDLGLAAATTAVDTALKGLQAQRLQSELYQLLDKVAKELVELRKVAAGKDAAGVAGGVTTARLDALQARISGGIDLWPEGVTAKERSALELTRTLQWPVPPLVPGAWQQLSIVEQKAEAARLSAGSVFERRAGARIARIRTLPLSFYEGAMLYEVETTRPAGAVYSYVRLPGRSDVLELNGQSPPIHTLNATGALRLDTAAQAAQYIRFFMNTIAAEEGNFRVLDSDDDLRFTSAASASLPGAMGRFIAPLELRRNHKGQWDAKATVRYSNAIFYAVLRVDNLRGHVTMVVDEPIAADLPLMVERFELSRRSLVAPVDDWKKKVAESQRSVATLLRDTSPLTPQRRDALASAYLGLSWHQLHTRDFAAALASTEAGLKIDPSYLALDTNRAHALLFLDRIQEAEQIYRGNIGRDTAGKPWEVVITDDINTLEKQGLTHPHFARVREIVAIKKP